jgi:hypothetical protein
VLLLLVVLLLLLPPLLLLLLLLSCLQVPRHLISAPLFQHGTCTSSATAGAYLAAGPCWQPALQATLLSGTTAVQQRWLQATAQAMQELPLQVCSVPRLLQQ